MWVRWLPPSESSSSKDFEQMPWEGRVVFPDRRSQTLCRVEADSGGDGLRRTVDLVLVLGEDHEVSRGECRSQPSHPSGNA